MSGLTREVSNKQSINESNYSKPSICLRVLTGKHIIREECSIGFLLKTQYILGENVLLVPTFWVYSQFGL